MNRAELRKLLDACRSEADLLLPEVTPLAEEMQRDPAVRQSWDLARRQDQLLRSALYDVEVPPGLEQRILADLPATSRPSSAAPETEKLAEEAGMASPAQRATKGSTGWRANWIGIAGVASAALVLVAVAFWWQREPWVGDENELARTWIDMLDQSGWIAATANPLPSERYPLPVQQLSATPTQWQALAKVSKSLRVVCYDLSPAENRAYLFVALAKPRTTLPAAPPPNPYSGYRWTVGAWHSPGAGVVYILATEGGPAHYQMLLKRRPKGIAARPTTGASCLIGKV